MGIIHQILNKIQYVSSLMEKLKKSQVNFEFDYSMDKK